MKQTVLALGLALAASAQAQEQPFWRPVVMGTEAMVVAEHPLQALAGMKALEAGGNAFDAALAIFYMTTVVVTLQQPYLQTPSGAGAVKMLMIHPETGVFHGGASPAKSDYVIGK